MHPEDVLGEGVLVALHQLGEQFPRPVQAGQHRRVVSLDVLEEHRAGSALEAGRDRGELQVRIDLRAHPDETAHRVEILDDACEIAQPVSRHDVASAVVARQFSSLPPSRAFVLSQGRMDSRYPPPRAQASQE